MSTMQVNRFCALLAISAALFVQDAASYTDVNEGCKLPTKYDNVIGYSPLYGPLNPNDVSWHNEEWAFRQYGPISKFTLYKAWFYDGEWHDPGELKGLQTWYGHGVEQHTDDDKLLFGAKRPHVPQNFTLYREEVLVRAELEWDDIMRWANFTSSLGRWFAWGFPNATAGVNKTVVQAPPGAYIAAFRGYEGKPLPKELGGYKKRYISQIGFVWAQRNCTTASSISTERSLPRERQPAVQRKPAADESNTQDTPAAGDSKHEEGAVAASPAKPAAVAVAATPAVTAIKTDKPTVAGTSAKPVAAMAAGVAPPATKPQTTVARAKKMAAAVDAPAGMPAGKLAAAAAAVPAASFSLLAAPKAAAVVGRPAAAIVASNGSKLSTASTPAKRAAAAGAARAASRAKSAAKPAAAATKPAAAMLDAGTSVPPAAAAVIGPVAPAQPTKPVEAVPTKSTTSLSASAATPTKPAAEKQAAMAAAAAPQTP